MRKAMYFLLGVLLYFACSPKSSTSTSSSASRKYTEDLSIWRPKTVTADTSKSGSKNSADHKPTVYVEPKFAVNEQLDEVLDSISRINLAMGFVDGFTIQLYSGLKREDALNVKKQIATTLPQLDAEVQYVQPNFRVRAGKYFDRFSALKDFQTIKRYFPNAILLPERIPIR